MKKIFWAIVIVVSAMVLAPSFAPQDSPAAPQPAASDVDMAVKIGSYVANLEGSLKSANATIVNQQNQLNEFRAYMQNVYAPACEKHGTVASALLPPAPKAYPARLKCSDGFVTMVVGPK